MEAMMATKMVITVDIVSGNVDHVKDENGNNIPQTLQAASHPPGGPRQVAHINWHRTNPTCITLNVAGGGQYQICF